LATTSSSFTQSFKHPVTGQIREANKDQQKSWLHSDEKWKDAQNHSRSLFLTWPTWTWSIPRWLKEL